MSKDEKKDIEPIFTEQCFQCALVIYNMGVLKYFVTESYTQRLLIAQKIFMNISSF